jgi:hypothetical protein
MYSSANNYIMMTSEEEDSEETIWAGNVASMREEMNAYKVFGG